MSCVMANALIVSRYGELFSLIALISYYYSLKIKVKSRPTAKNHCSTKTSLDNFKQINILHHIQIKVVKGKNSGKYK